MTRRLMMTGVLALLLGAATTVATHDNYRIIGTITTVKADTLTVKQTKDGRVIEMDMDRNTKVTRQKTRLTVADLKAGLSVVVDATGDSIFDLLVKQVAIFPPPTK